MSRKNFLIGYVIAFAVLIGLRILIDLFVNLDEFTEHADLGALAVIKNILTFYALNTTLYFRDFAGMITVVAAVFSLGKMVHNNELIAMMSSGVSLKRVIAPIIVLAMIFTGLLIIDQELIIPPLSDKLVRGQDAVPGQETYNVWFIDDGNGSLICSQKFEVATSTLYKPTIILRTKVPKQSNLGSDRPDFRRQGCLQSQNPTDGILPTAGTLNGIRLTGFQKADFIYYRHNAEGYSRPLQIRTQGTS